MNRQKFLIEVEQERDFKEGITFTREVGGQKLYSITYSGLDIIFFFNPNKMNASLPDSFILLIFAKIFREIWSL